MTITQRDVVPQESDREYLLELWKQCLVEMIADVEETKRRWQDASQTVRAESLAAVADARAAFSEALIKLEHATEERLGRLRQLVDEKNGPRVHPYVEDRVHYAGAVRRARRHRRIRRSATPVARRQMRAIGSAWRPGVSMVGHRAYGEPTRPPRRTKGWMSLHSTVRASSRNWMIPGHARETVGNCSLPPADKESLASVANVVRVDPILRLGRSTLSLIA